MRLGIILPSEGAIDMAIEADGLGFDSVWIPDTFAEGEQEAVTTMAAVAARTVRIEVGAYMLNASLRDTAILTRTVASLDSLAPGRIRVLLGTGWKQSDYEDLGRAYPAPKERTERTAELLRALKRDTSVVVEVAGSNDAVIQLAAAEADGWALSAEALDAFHDRVAALERACHKAGRDLDRFRVSCTLPDLDSATDRICQLTVRGVEEFRIAASRGELGRVREIVDAVTVNVGARKGEI